MVNTGLNRVEELFEARNPHGLGVLAPFAGKVEISELNYDYDISLKAQQKTVVEVDVCDCQVFVKLNQTVAEDGLLAARANQEAILSPMAAEVIAIDDNLIRLQSSKVLEKRFF